MHNRIALLEENLCETQEDNVYLKEYVDALEDNFVDNLCLKDNTVDITISSELKKAFQEYEKQGGPEVLLTSLKRHTNPKSRHFTGDAADIRFDKRGREFLKWITTENGKTWKREHNIRCILEFPRKERKFHKWAKIYPFTIVNENATGVHIHIERKNRALS